MLQANMITVLFSPGVGSLNVAPGIARGKQKQKIVP